MSLEKENAIWKILENVSDPEVPVLTIIDLGIVRNIKVRENEIFISITSTYTGCPAMDMIATQIKFELNANGFEKVIVNQDNTVAWTTDWMTEVGKQKLQEYGIAPPEKKFRETPSEGVVCPHCKKTETILISEFGSTACKALFKCSNCLEPFDYFKCY